MTSLWSTHSLWVALGYVLTVGPLGQWGYLEIKYRETKVRGPALLGTAEVLSVKVGPWVIGKSGRRPCRLELRVQIPGRETYEVTIRQNLENLTLKSSVQPGRTVAVQVEEAEPQHVRVDLSRELPPGG